MRRNVPVGHPDFGEAFLCECAIRAWNEYRWTQSWWAGYREAELTDSRQFQPKTASSIIAKIEAWIAKTLQPDIRPGYYLWSHRNGTGKTHLAMAIMRHFGPRFKGYAVLVSDLFQAMRDAYNPDSIEQPTDILKRYTEIPLLILDDLGSERPTAWMEEQLFGLILKREAMKQQVLTIITSNLSREELIGFYPSSGQRIASRIAAMCEEWEISGADRRLQR